MKSLSSRLYWVCHHSNNEKLNEFVSHFVQNQNSLQTITDRLSHMVSSIRDTKDLIERGKVENQTLRDISEVFKSAENESVFPDEETVNESRVFEL